MGAAGLPHGRIGRSHSTLRIPPTAFSPSAVMPQAFDAQNPPFDRLTHGETAELRAKLDIGYWAPGDTIIAAGKPSENLHVIIKGAVEERDGEEIEAVLGPKDSFDARALVHGAAGSAFVAADET